MKWRQDREQDRDEAQAALLQHERALAEVTYRSNPQTMQNFAIPTVYRPQHNYRHHYDRHFYPLTAIVPNSVQGHQNAFHNNPEDLTEQIRISVQDTHISQRTYFNESGGNISDVHESFDEESSPTFGNIEHMQSSHHHSNLSLDPVRRPQYRIRRTQIPTDNQFYTNSNHLGSIVPQPSTSTSTSPEHRLPTSSLVVLDASECSSVHETQVPTTSRLAGEATSFGGEGESNVPIFLKLKTQTFDGALREPEIKPNQYKDESENLDSEPTLATDEPTGKLDTHYTIPPYTHNPQAGVIKNYLYNGFTFWGYQKSRLEKYEVNVQIQHVDYENSYLYGYLNIAHLTESHPSLTTFFEGEIISERYPFLTRKWEANDKIDREHWSKFDDFAKNYADTFNSDHFEYDKLKCSDYIYMRWKERFLVPDHTVKKVLGASYEGFYYTCYSKRTSRIKGYYFHIEERIESFQSLDLKLDCRERNSQVYEFR